MKSRKHWLILGSTALVTASLLSGCSSFENKDQPSQATGTPPSALVAQDQAAAYAGQSLQLRP